MQLPQATLLKDGQYVVERTLGQGGFGITYLCEEPSLSRRVAVKEFFPAGSERLDQHLVAGRVPPHQLQAGLRRFEKEARTLAALEHPNIVRVVGLFAERSTFYLVTEYVAGEVLSASHRDWLKPIASALCLIHSHGLVHGDVKPDNILVQSNGRPVLIDFGSTCLSHCAPTSILVSHGYSPPEQYTGRVLTTASDQYALASTWVDWHVGQPPPAALDRLHGQALPPLPAAVARALSLDPQDRWPDLDAFVQALERPALPSSLPRPAGMQGWVRALAASSQWLASGGEDKQVRLWDTTHWQPTLLGEHPGWVVGLQFHHGDLLSLSTDGTLKLWEVSSGKCTDELKLPGSPQSIARSQEHILVGGDRGQVWRIGLGPLRLLSHWQAGSSAVNAMAISGKVLACTGDGNRVSLWDLTQETLVERLKGHQAPVRACCFYADCLYSGGQDRKILRWDWREGRSETIASTQGTVWCLAANQGGLVSGSGDKRVHLWGPTPRLLGQAQGEIRCLALSPDWIAAAGQDGQIGIYSWSE
jgi:WD40 repeat protein